METKLYVANLAYSTTEIDLRTLFAQAGNITSIDLVKDRDSGQSKGFAFVTMSTPAEAQKAISMLNALPVNDRELKVDVAKPREGRAGPPSRGGAFGHGGGTPRVHKRRGGNRQK
jgi:RNA recognition motif-containing protein